MHEEADDDHELVSVYQIINEARQEIFVGVTDRLMPRLEHLHLLTPPKAISHWKPDEPRRYQAVEYACPRDRVKEFVRAYLKAAARKGWTVISE